MASCSSRLLYAIQHHNMVLIDWQFSLAEQHLSRINICFFLQKTNKKPQKTTQKNPTSRADWFPNISLFSYFALSSDTLQSPDKSFLGWCLCEDIPLDYRTNDYRIKLRQLSALPELSARGAGTQHGNCFFCFSTG